MALSKLNQVNDGLTDLQVKLEPLEGIAMVRRNCPEVLDESAANDYEETQWREVKQLITEIKLLTQ